MEETKEIVPVQETTPPPPENPEAELPAESNRGKVILVVLGIVLLVGLTVAGVVYLFSKGPETTSHIRDVFIIFMALESLIIGAALVILIVQLSILINLLQNEIKPIIDSTNETVNTIRGTASFISDNLSEPVIKLNEYVAYISKFVEILRPKKK